jgi:hypothetical protein
MLKRVNARQLLQFSTGELWDKLTGQFILVMEDGEIEANYKEVLYSSYAWEYHRCYPETPLLLKHFSKTSLGKQRMTTESHLDLLNECLWSTYDIYKNQVPMSIRLLDKLAQMSYEITNTMYNDLTYRLEDYVTSLDILDFLNITTHPTITAALTVMPPTEEGIISIQDIIMSVVDSEEMLDNPLAKAMLSKIVSKGQALQCLGPRGFLTDIDSHVFKAAPIKEGYVKGIVSLYDSMIDSRSAAKSLIFSTDPLQKSEYFSRRQQLICMNVKSLHLVDCGSQHYLQWPIRDTYMVGNSKIQSDLVTLAGKYYLDEESNTLKIVTVKDKHLLGKVLKIRSVIAGCNHPDPTGVCQYCYGETGLSIPENSNLGHITCVSMTSELGQLILSTKHFDGSSAVEWIILKPHEKKYLDTKNNGTSYYLSQNLKDKEVKLIIAASQAMGLTDVNLVDQVEILNLARVSEFENITILSEDKEEKDIATLSVSLNGRNSTFTHEMLRYVKKVGWTVTKENNYEINMKDWDYNLPMLILPMRHFNMSDLQT